jgi:hypothetical protein
MTLPDRCSNIAAATRLAACLVEVCLATGITPIRRSSNRLAHPSLLLDSSDSTAGSIASSSSKRIFRNPKPYKTH